MSIPEVQKTKLSHHALAVTGKALCWGPEVTVESEFAYILNEAGNLIEIVRKQRRTFHLDDISQFIIVWPMGITYVESAGKVEQENTNPNNISEKKWVENNVILYSCSPGLLIQEVAFMPILRRRFMLEKVPDVEVRTDGYDEKIDGGDIDQNYILPVPSAGYYDGVSFALGIKNQDAGLFTNVYGWINIWTVEQPFDPYQFVWSTYEPGMFIKMQFPQAICGIQYQAREINASMKYHFHVCLQQITPKPYNRTN